MKIITHDLRGLTERGPIINVRQTAKGRFKAQVVAPNGRVLEDRPWQNNLILDQGLNGLAVRSWQASFAYCAAGTGNTPTQYDSGAITASSTPDANPAVNESVVTSSADFFAGKPPNNGTTDSVGMLIRWDSGETAKIITFTSATSVRVAGRATVGSGEFTIYAVNQTSLTTEARRNTSYMTGAGNCGTSIVDNTLTMKRTYEFAAVTDPGGENIAELGFSWDADDDPDGDNLFSRVLIAGGTVNVAQTFQLRVIYELAVTVEPDTAQARTVPITGWLNQVRTTTITGAGSGGTPGTYALGVTGGNGTAFAGTYTIGGGGSLSTITITNHGYGYTVAPSLSFPSGGGGGGALSGASATANLDAWTQGDEQVQGWGLERVESSGSGSYGAAANEPCNAGLTVLSEDAAALKTAGTADDRSQTLASSATAAIANLLGSYTAGTFTMDKTCTFGVLEGLSSDIRAIMLCGPGGGNDSEVCFTYLFDNPQEKLNTHRMSVTWRHTWNRSF